MKCHKVASLALISSPSRSHNNVKRCTPLVLRRNHYRKSVSIQYLSHSCTPNDSTANSTSTHRSTVEVDDGATAEAAASKLKKMNVWVRNVAASSLIKVKDIRTLSKTNADNILNVTASLVKYYGVKLASIPKYEHLQALNYIKSFGTYLPLYSKKNNVNINKAEGVDDNSKELKRKEESVESAAEKNNNVLVASKTGPVVKEIKQGINVNSESPNKNKIISTSSSNSVVKVKRELISKASLQNRTKFLVQALSQSISNSTRFLRIEEFCSHLYKYPEARSIAVREKAVKYLLLISSTSKDVAVQESVREALTLLGYVNPPKGRGIRILSMDGGGLRGMVAIEVMRRLEELTGKSISDLFDFICGVSTGANLAVLAGALHASPEACEKLYKTIGTEIFTQNSFVGAGKLVLNHAYYNTDNWSKLLRENLGDRMMIETSRDSSCPKLAVISTVVNKPRLQAFIFRNYDYSPKVTSNYPGTFSTSLWQSVQASAAAPLYFEECKLGDDIHQDGGIMVNNPTALAIHECKLLWPTETIQCVVSLGNGRYECPSNAITPMTYTGIKDKLMKIIDSATDTEAVHTMLNDLLPRGTYFRINPYLSEEISLDETRPAKIELLQQDAKLYLRKNDHKVRQVVDLLTQHRSPLQKAVDYVKQKTTLLL